MQLTAWCDSDEIKKGVKELLLEAIENASIGQGLGVQILISNWILDPELKLETSSGQQQGASLGDYLSQLASRGGRVEVSLSPHFLKIPNKKTHLQLCALGVTTYFESSKPFGSSHEKLVVGSIGNKHFIIIGSADLNKKRLPEDPTQTAELSVLLELESTERPCSVDEYLDLFASKEVMFCRIKANEPPKVARKKLLDFFNTYFLSTSGALEIHDQYGLVGSTPIKRLVAEAISNGRDVTLIVPGVLEGFSHQLSSRWRKLSNMGLNLNETTYVRGGEPGMIHRKCVLFQGCMLIGSVSMARRSFFLDGEIVAEIRNSKFVNLIRCALDSCGTKSIYFSLTI